MQSTIVPWRARVHDKTLIVNLPESYRVMSWAPLGGGLVEACTIINHQVDTNEELLLESTTFLRELVQRLDLDSPVVGLMTGVLMERLVRKVVGDESCTLECFATVGLSNALAAGDPATYDERPGTINLIIACSQPLTPVALIEAIAIGTEAKVRALYAAGVKSTVSEALATGTGTDCVAVACPLGVPAYQYCGKHTRLGELVGTVVFRAIEEGLRKAR
jgi:adenosylcobinamide hydrolase